MAKYSTEFKYKLVKTVDKEYTPEEQDRIKELVDQVY